MITFILSCVVHAISFVFLYSTISDIDVFQMLLLIFIPLLISLIFCYWENSNKTRHVKFNSLLLFILPNIVYLLASSYFINKNIDDIFALSQKYQSENLTISTSNSPTFGFAMLLVITVVLHYAVSRVGANRNHKLQ
ncbi:hypothetical protein D1B31_01160 [Neobacillus notoginsengisoli]|uniref:Uncharacterized protein n=1 Tax=Neobacillus notoginsengisoli TaxID=1578198 RepID=A0A417YZJ1_9BACI|nr:hypothetical protein D1B31_01160 [Neobacillus notoginsengisoli]